MDTVEKVVALKTDAIAKWTQTVTAEVERVFTAQPDLSQLQATYHVSQELHNLFNSYPGPFGIRVNPKGDKEIQVILTLSELGDQPHIKIKPRFKVPSLVGEAA